MRCAAALSEHPLATQAVGECMGHLLEVGGDAPDLVAVFATPPHAGVLEDMVAATRSVLNPYVLFGSSAAGVLGWGRSTGDAPALSMFGLWAECGGPVVEPAHLRPLARGGTDDLHALTGRSGTLVLVCDPFSWRGDELVDQLGRVAPDLRVVGGSATAATGPGGNRLLLQDAQHREGAVGVLIDDVVDVGVATAQGAVPIGPPYTVTAGGGGRIEQLGGRPALERLSDELEFAALHVSAGLDRPMTPDALRIGRVLSASGVAHEHEQLLISRVLGQESDGGAIVVEDEVAVGDTVQFHRIDDSTRSRDLITTVNGWRPQGALVFAGLGRFGGTLVGIEDDGLTLAELFDDAGIAGMATGQELAPIGTRNRVFSTSAALVMFGDRNRISGRTG